MTRTHTPWRLSAMALSIGLIGTLAGCGGGGGDTASSSSGNTNTLVSAPLSLDVYGARGGTLTAASSNCNGDLQLTWQSYNQPSTQQGSYIDDPDPSAPLLVRASCGFRTAVQSLAPQTVFASPSVFAVAKADGTLAVWGSNRLGGDTSALAVQPKNVVQVAGSERAWAALQKDGTVISWGRGASGGNHDGKGGVGSGDYMGPVVPLNSVTKLWPLKRGFVALNKDGSATAWGNLEVPFDGNGDFLPIPSFFSSSTIGQFRDITDVSYSEGAVAALKKDGTVFAFGDPSVGGDTSAVAAKLNNVVKLYSTDYSFTALKKDGSVVTWGMNFDNNDTGLYDGTEPMPLSNLSLLSNRNVIAALSQSGVVSTIGSVIFDRGADLSAFKGGLSNVAKVFASKTAFAALKKDGTVVTWGDSQRNDVGSVQAQLNNVATVASTETAFAALKKDGTVVTWGDETRGGDSSAVQAKLSNVVALFSNDYAFAALKKDGTVVTWGAAAHGGDSSAVQAKLQNIRAIYSTGLGGFLAVSKDGQLVNWGSPSAGGGKLPAGLTTIPYLKS
ncbi:RCC1 domain-containing protein [Chromobacterium paludis]|uniref:Chromosome condensation regulator RCC1 n=1 Tax=Chromobacterium paludis TaxID=2605945 RepID=A0A5C1DKT5_9NEIS|nr:hypothetical protein [Chromobacterium paludis]QEL57315.1 hypothetical protein FYK34_17955 [Chromobacterium paludis]